MTNVYLIRHAHSTYTPDEIGRPLSSKGFADAEQVSKALENEPIDIFLSSPYKRAIQTVEGIAGYSGKEIQLEDGFKERTLSEKPVDDFNLAIRKVWNEPAFCWEGGESNIVAQKRGVDAIINVLEKYEGKNIAIGTHGNIMVLIMNSFSEKYGFHFWQDLDMPDIYKLTFENKDLKEVKRLWTRS